MMYLFPIHSLDGWIGLCSVLRPLQHSIGYMEDGTTPTPHQLFWRDCSYMLMDTGACLVVS